MSRAILDMMPCLDVYLHNTMVMPSHIHLSLLLGPLLIAFGIIYAIFPDLTKKHLSKTLGEIHFWLTIFGGFGMAILFNIIAMQEAIRREELVLQDWVLTMKRISMVVKN
jgi:cytochrome c oxidase subunit I